MKQERNLPPPLTLEAISQQARESLLKDGEHLPTLIIQGNGQVIVVGISDMADTHDGRMEQMAVTGFAIARRGDIRLPEQVYFITEAWMSMAKPGQEPVNPPSKDPQRQEMLMISGLELAARETKLMMYEMIRDRKGKLREVRAHPLDPEMTVESPLLAAFMYGFVSGLQTPNA